MLVLSPTRSQEGFFAQLDRTFSYFGSDQFLLHRAKPIGLTGQPGASWKLVWSDEFNQPDGSAPDPAKWTALSGGSGWGNKELEYYTSRSENVHVSTAPL